MKYSFASVGNSVNSGNLLIEYNLFNVLTSKGFAKPDFVFDSFANPNPGEPKKIAEQINRTDFLIMPGCTTLTSADYPMLEAVLPKIKVQIFNLGAAFSGQSDKPDLNNIERYYQPIGVRDPFSQRYLIASHINCEFIGCPTLFSSDAVVYNESESDEIAVFLGYKMVNEQRKLLKHLIDAGYRLTIPIQEENQHKIIEGLKVDKITYKPKNVIELLKRSRITLSARLHGALPSIAAGTPVFLIKTIDDFRFSLLDYLEIACHDPDDMKIVEKLDQFLSSNDHKNESTYRKVGDLRSKFSSYIDLIKSEI